MTRWILLLLAVSAVLHADGPKDNIPEKVRPIPAHGVEVPAEQRTKLEAGLAELQQAIDAVRKKEGLARDLLPDVEIFYRAVHDGLTYQEFAGTKQIDLAFTLLDVGKRRAADLLDGNAPWTTQTGLVVRGFVSRIDGSVQPYGVNIPASYAFSGSNKYRTDLWFHGRDEGLVEVNFLELRMNRPDQIAIYAPKDTVVVYPYGRYCTASKFAGETDSLEALAEAKRRYRIDDERISVRGFSMGGAASWHFTVHYADCWFASNPGAGFADTPKFLDYFQHEKLTPTPWERKLWNWYDCNPIALNVLQCPTVAYSGADDPQRKSAEVMDEALKERGIEMIHIIAPKTGHKVIQPQAKEVEARMEALSRGGRQRIPHSVAFELFTLKYNRMNWVTVDALGEHWVHAEVRASLAGPSLVNAKTENVTALTFAMDAGDCPWDVTAPVTIAIDGQKIKDAPRPGSDRSWRVSLHREGEKWKLGARPAEEVLKRHDLQGPIDDAFMDAFIFVRPTGTAANEAVGKWADSELKRAIEQWRQQFRGYAIVKDDAAVTDEDIATKHLVLWGDPSSNSVLKKIADKLPIHWGEKVISAGDVAWDGSSHAAILIHPNPLNPARYVVLNSSFTYREYAYLNNARQVPMLPDWAIVDVRVPADSVHPGKIDSAGFFDEQWRWKGEEK